MHIARDQKRAGRLLGEPLLRQASARIDQNRKGELAFTRRPAQLVRSLLRTGSHSQQRDVGMMLAKRIQILVIPQAVGADAGPEDHDSSLVTCQLAAKASGNSSKIHEAEVQDFAADFL